MPNTGELQRFGGSPGMRASPRMGGPMGMPSGYPGMGAMQGLEPGGSLGTPVCARINLVAFVSFSCFTINIIHF